MTLFQSIIIAIVEGITEYLPISSTGHMIIAERLLGVASTDFTKIFTISIQLGAILSVVVLYWRRFVQFKNPAFYVKLLIAVVPALVLGYLFGDAIDSLLENATVVAIMLLLGGIVLLLIDKAFHVPEIRTEDQIGYKNAFLIGLWQCVAMIPGVSRSAASIIGGMQQKLTRNLAAEFSFFLAVPTMAAATGYTLLLKNWSEGPEKLTGLQIITQSQQNMVAFVTGNLVAFVVAMAAIKFFIGFLQRHGFKPFGWYRILVGLVLLVLIATGHIQ